jgi:hypothetical protein
LWLHSPLASSSVSADAARGSPPPQRRSKRSHLKIQVQHSCRHTLDITISRTPCRRERRSSVGTLKRLQAPNPQNFRATHITTLLRSTPTTFTGVCLLTVDPRKCQCTITRTMSLRTRNLKAHLSCHAITLTQHFKAIEMHRCRLLVNHRVCDRSTIGAPDVHFKGAE